MSIYLRKATSMCYEREYISFEYHHELYGTAPFIVGEKFVHLFYFLNIIPCQIFDQKVIILFIIEVRFFVLYYKLDLISMLAVG